MDLIVEQREKLGKVSKNLLKQGFIPAEFYGHQTDNIHLSVRQKDFEKVFREAGENTIINLLIGGKPRPSLIYDIQRDYLSNSVIHIDFYGVKMDEKIRVPVPLVFSGEAPAVKEKGGILNKTLTEIEIEALPVDLPHEFNIDLSSLSELNQSIYVKDLAIPPKAKVLLEPEMVIVTVTQPVEEEKPEPAAEVGEVKVEAEEKVAERAALKQEKQEKKEEQ